jgi:peroxiredoxin
LGGFGEQYSELQQLNSSVVAASTDTLENSVAIAADLPFPVAHGVTREQADTLGSWWEDRRGLIQPSNFVLNHEGKVLSATYSSGPIGRAEAADVVRFITFQEKLRTQNN